MSCTSPPTATRAPRVAALYPSLAAAYPGSTYGPMDPAARGGLDVVFLAMPHGASQRFAPRLSSTGRPRRRPRRRLPAARRPSTSSGTATPHTAPELIDQFAYGMVELYRDEHRRDRRTSPRPGLLPDRGVARAGAAVRRRAGRAARDRRRDVRACRARAVGSRSASHFSEADESVSAYGLLTHRHTAEIEQALDEGGGRAGATRCSRRTSCRWCAGCRRRVTRSRPRRRAVDRSRCCELYREFYADGAVRGGRGRAAADEGRDRRQHVSRHRALRRPHRSRARARGARQPGQGRVGRARCRTPTCCSASPRPPASRPSGCGHERASTRMHLAHGRRAGPDGPARGPRVEIVSVTARGVRRGWSGVWDQAGRRGRSRDRRDRGSSPGAGGRRVHHQLACAAPVQISRAHLDERSGRGGRAVLGQRERGDRGAGPRRCPPDGRTHGRGPRLRTRRRAGVLDRADRLLHADGARWSPGSRRCARDLNGATAAADAILTTDTVRKEAVASRSAPRARSSAGWPRARRCCRRRWPRCSRCSPPTSGSTPARCLQAALGAAVDRHVQPAAGRRFDEHQRHGAGARQRRVGHRRRVDRSRGPRAHRRAHRRLWLAGRTDGARRRRARPSSSGCEWSARAATARTPVARPAASRLAARAVLVQRRGPLLGPDPVRARCQRRGVRPGA